jgi:hypothetical protein
MAQLELSNVINISVSAAPAGIGAYNVSNVSLFTRETPGGGFGSDGFKIYKSPSEVSVDFGSGSDSAQMANALFAQQPNILAGGGYLVVIPFASTSAVIAQQHISFPTVPASGAYKLKYGANTSASIAYNDNAAAVQVALRALSGLSSVTVTGDTSVGFTVVFTGVSGPATLLQVTTNSLQDVTPLDVFPSVATTVVGTVLSTETLADAITRTKDLVQYFGIISQEIMSSTPLLAAAAVVQDLNKILFVASKTAADVDPGGLLDLLRTGSLDQTRGLLYVGSGLTLDSLLFMSAYAGRALSTDFNGSNTTQTMHLKDLKTIQPDSGMTQTILEKCKIAGADVYVSLQGVPKVFSVGGNRFFDQVYNEQWIVGALQVAGFNVLAELSTKLPQTEQGISVLKAAYRTVCDQAVANQYLAPGSWTSGDTFGNLNDFLRNIQERGYYIYSSPIATQLPANRAARQAPLIQIAIKEAGAVQSSDVIIFVNA